MSIKSPQKSEYNNTEIEVNCGCQLSPLIYNHKLYVPVTSANGNDILEIYDLANGQKCTQEVKRNTQEVTVSYAGCKMFYLKNISLMIISSKTKLRLYQLDKTSAWELISCPSAIQLLDHKNSIPISFKDNGVIVISVVNQQSTSQIKFYIFSLSIATNLKSASSKIRYNTNYQIQSCAMLLNYIYCGLLAPEGAYIYKFDIASLQKETHGISSNQKWHMKNATLQNFFISVFKEEIFIISIFTNADKSIMEIRRLLDSPEISSAEYQLEFSCVVKVVAASVISGIKNPVIVLMYHNVKTGKCYIKRVDFDTNYTY